MTIEDAAQAAAKCEYCAAVADPALRFLDKPICRICAHAASRGFSLRPNELPCPVVDESGNVLPYGVWPNLDFS